MTPEFVYQNNYGSTIDTLALRENVKKILVNAGVQASLSKPSVNTEVPKDTLKAELLDAVEEYSISDNTKLHKSLKGTLDFLNSEAALKLLKLTNSKRELEMSEDANLASIVEFKLDESKKNIFAV